MAVEGITALVGLFGTFTLSLVGWTARELYRTSKTQSKLQQRVRYNEKRLNQLQE